VILGEAAAWTSPRLPSADALTVTARDPARLNAVGAEVAAAGVPDVVLFAADMADPDAAEEIVAVHWNRFGALRAQVLNAGVGTATDRRLPDAGSTNGAVARMISQSARLSPATPFEDAACQGFLLASDKKCQIRSRV